MGRLTSRPAWPNEVGSGSRATTIEASRCSDAEIVRAYRDLTTTVESGIRWIKSPAAIHPVWLEKRERIAALAMLTVDQRKSLIARGRHD